MSSLVSEIAVKGERDLSVRSALPRRALSTAALLVGELHTRTDTRANRAPHLERHDARAQHDGVVARRSAGRLGGCLLGRRGRRERVDAAPDAADAAADAAHVEDDGNGGAVVAVVVTPRAAGDLVERERVGTGSSQRLRARGVLIIRSVRARDREARSNSRKDE